MLKTKKIRNFIKSFNVEINQTPVIILGNQKSGTSAIAHLLADYGGLTKTVDIPEMWYPKLEKLLLDKKKFCNFVKKNRLPFSKELIKEPNLTFFYDELTKCFPQAKFCMVMRDPRDNIRSLLNRVNIPGNLEELDTQSYRIPSNWGILFESEVWGIQSENYIDILAERWNQTADVYLNNKDSIILCLYEEFIKDKERYINNLASQLNISHRNDIKKQLDIQYQPKGKDRNRPWRDFFGTKNLMRIEKICGPKMIKLGYEI